MYTEDEPDIKWINTTSTDNEADATANNFTNRCLLD